MEVVVVVVCSGYGKKEKNLINYLFRVINKSNSQDSGEAVLSATHQTTQSTETYRQDRVDGESSVFFHFLFFDLPLPATTSCALALFLFVLFCFVLVGLALYFPSIHDFLIHSKQIICIRDDRFTQIILCRHLSFDRDRLRS